MDKQLFQSWIQDASPDDLVDIGKTVLGRIGTLNSTYQDKFTKSVANDPAVSKLLNRQGAHA